MPSFIGKGKNDFTDSNSEAAAGDNEAVSQSDEAAKTQSLDELQTLTSCSCPRLKAMLSRKPPAGKLDDSVTQFF